MITLNELQAAFHVTKRRATPHRHPDFEAIREASGVDDPPVGIGMVFLEEHNTGYDGNLERYMCRVEPNIHFQIDLLEGLVTSEPKDE